MTFAGHIGGSLAITAVVQQVAFGHKLTPKVLGLGVLIGLLPDLDALLALIVGRWHPGDTQLLHHQYLTHTPLFYLLLALGLWTVTSFEFAVLFAALTLGHLLLDTWGTDDGIMWLWPTSKRQLGILSAHLHTGGVYGLSYYWRYLQSWRTSIPELLLLVIGIGIVVRTTHFSN
jgi:hypothetical protein